MKVLIVEDTPSLAENILQYLEREAYYCRVVPSCEDALEALVGQPFDIVLLDVMLPDGNGLDVLKEINQLEFRPGVLIISAKNALNDRLNGLDLGADDYLTKPFHLSELLARVKAIHRRRTLNENARISVNELLIDTQTLEVFVHDQPLTLTRKEYELLNYFLANKNRVLTKQAIAEYLWGDQIDIYDSFDFVYQHIKNLRKKITQAGGNDYISTIYGMGYKFNLKSA